MTLLKNIHWLFTALLCIAMLSGCSEDEIVSNSGTTGYLKLRLTSSKVVTRATTLDYLSDAKKIEVSMLYNDMVVSQSLALSSVADASDLGLESEKLELNAGDYTVMSYIIYGAVKPGMEKPEKLATIYPDEAVKFQISGGHITELDVEVKATVRGFVYFDLLKDLSNYQDKMDQANGTNTRAVSSFEGAPEDFNYDNVKEVDLYYRRKGTDEYPTPHTFKLYQKSGERYMHTDTVNWESGEYELTRYMLYDEKRTTMLLAGDLKDTYIKVATGICTQGSFDIKFPENMKAFNDYFALYNIWIKMDGPNWSYVGESFPVGANWRFANRTIDQWGNQPGVTIDGAGRVKTLDLGAFNPANDVPDELGQLTELVSLALGTHSDQGVLTHFEDPLPAALKQRYNLSPIELQRRGIDYAAHRMEIEKERLRILHPSTAYKSRLLTPAGIPQFKYAIPALYEDFELGSYSNRITGITEEIKNLKQLTNLSVANGQVTELPMGLAELPELTDVEVYNCRFRKFPEVLTKMKNIIALNISCCNMMEGDELYEGLNKVALNNSNLQILYATSCKLNKFPEALGHKDSKIGLLDMTTNQLKELPSTEGLAPVQAFFDNNKIHTVAPDFCTTDDLEEISLANNMLTEVPNIFGAEGAETGKNSPYRISSIDLSFNKIQKFPADFGGINVETLILTKNDFGNGNKVDGKRTFPDDLNGSPITNLVIANCEIDTFVVDYFKDIEQLASLDLSGNRLSNLSREVNASNLTYVSGVNLGYNSFSKFPLQVMNLPMLNKLYLNDQWKSVNGKEIRTLKEWPTSLGQYPGYATLRTLDISYNDITKIDEVNFPILLNEFNISDNENIEVHIPSDICTKITQGLFMLGFNSSQYILGCPALDLDIND